MRVTRRLIYIVAFSLLTTGRPPEAQALNFSRIMHWTGTGTNRAALVVDWNDGTRPDALAWGFRWDGTATALDMWEAVTQSDSGLSGSLTNTTAGMRPTLLEYRRPTRPGDILPGTGPHDVYHTAYTWDHTGTVFQTGTWTYWTHDGTTNYIHDTFSLVEDGIEHRVLTNNAWDAYVFDANGSTQRPGRVVMPAVPYPFASTVVDYSFGNGFPPMDWIDGSLFTNPVTALGRPTVDTTSEAEHPAAVVPVYPPYRAFELVSIGENGHLTLAFDHPVWDHPDNPYGIDFIVFGNSFQNIGGGQAWNHGDPNATIVGPATSIRLGQVSVSQDGTNWIEYVDGPFANDFMPTLGRVYDPDHPHDDWPQTNLWWGGATDPTVPVDPSVVSSNWSGYSVAQIAQRYRGSAGGVGFDLADLPLEPHPITGRKWIRYIRFQRTGSMNTVIDAVAAVSPALPYDRWITEHFDWMDDPAYEDETQDASGNGLPNLLAYALGRDPALPSSEPVFTTHIDLTDSPSTLRVEHALAPFATDLRLRIVHTPCLVNPAWSTNNVYTTPGPSSLIHHMPVDTNHRFLRLEVERE